MRPPIEIAAKAPVDEGIVDGGVDSTPSRPKRSPRPRKSPGIATA
jgi:cell division protease FtsH